MAVPENIIDNIRDSIDIVDLIREYIMLKQAGVNYKALCPFHKEKTPSFTVSHEKQIYHCFGCGEGGNVFSFLMKMENISFPEALERLAKRTGIQLPRKQEDYHAVSEKQKQKESLYELNEQACRFFQKSLQGPAGALARKYLEKRGLTREIIERFRIGCAPYGRDVLLKSAGRKGFSNDILNLAGLVCYSSARSSCHDYFINRVIFPIFNPQGRIIGFGGRALEANQQPKYLNSPDTPLFKKSMVLYGLEQAKPAIRQNSNIILLEGYMDVIALAQFGFDNAVATLGTALTEDQIRILSRYSQELILIYDADEAGAKAVLRGTDLLIKSDMKIRIAVLPSQKDPDEFLHKFGSEKFKKVLDDALPLMDYRIKKAVQSVKNIKNTQDKIEVLRDLLPLISQIKNIVEQREELRKLSSVLSIDESALYLEFQKIDSGANVDLAKSHIFSSSIPGYLQAQYDLIGIMIREPERISVIKDMISSEDFSEPVLGGLVEKLYDLSGDKRNVDPKILMDYFHDDGLNRLLSKILLTEYPQISEELIMGLIKTVKIQKLKGVYEKIRKEIDDKSRNGEEISSEKLQECQRLASLIKSQ